MLHHTSRQRRGSPHGYDIVDHSQLNPEVGTEEEYDAMTDTLRQFGMGQILDVVPNRMCITGKDNRWWMDVLENEGVPFIMIFLTSSGTPLRMN